MPRVLIIDDDSQVRMMLGMTFEGAGYEVDEAPDGDAGIRLFHKNRADVVITDLFMPKKEGVETIMELKENFPDIKIIAISGGGSVTPHGYLEVAEQLGAVLTFSKPLNREKLVKAVDKIVDR